MVVEGLAALLFWGAFFNRHSNFYMYNICSYSRQSGKGETYYYDTYNSCFITSQTRAKKPVHFRGDQSKVKVIVAF